MDGRVWVSERLKIMLGHKDRNKKTDHFIVPRLHTIQGHLMQTPEARSVLNLSFLSQGQQSMYFMMK